MRNLTRAQKSLVSSHHRDFYDNGEIDLKYHSLRCEICRHPSRELVEEAFLQWRSPRTIMRVFELKSQTALYHHAHAFKLFAIRDRNLRYALGNMIENADTVPLTGPQDVVRAAYAFAHINEDGRWVHPTTKSEVIVSASRPQPLPTGSFARHEDGAAPGQPRFASPPSELRELPAATAAEDPAENPACAPPAEPQSIATVRKSENDANH
ncbi:MAG: hypothetical protein WA192_19540 [Candidatus Acidiferrales bacterium]